LVYFSSHLDEGSEIFPPLKGLVSEKLHVGQAVAESGRVFTSRRNGHLYSLFLGIHGASERGSKTLLELGGNIDVGRLGVNAP